MYLISDVTKMVGVARSTLLYYERISLISPIRDTQNGYRLYSESDVSRLILLKQLQKAGLTLSQCRRFLEGKPDVALIEERLGFLTRELSEMQMAKDLLASIYRRISRKQIPDGDPLDMRQWHADFEKRAAKAHQAWLQQLGFSAKDALYVRWISRNMQDNEEYVSDFFRVFEEMYRQGPGSREATLAAFGKIPESVPIDAILDVGCGSGSAALVLAGAGDAMITAVDNHQPFLDRLAAEAKERGWEHRFRICNMDMHHLEFQDRSFDLIWAEGSAYIMGFEAALSDWRSLLKTGGYLFVSDAVWLTDSPSDAARDYFAIEYPNMADSPTRALQAKNLGYEVVHQSVLPRGLWTRFYDDMEKTVIELTSMHGTNRAWDDMRKEIQLDREHGDDYGYICLLLKKVNSV